MKNAVLPPPADIDAEFRILSQELQGKIRPYWVKLDWFYNDFVRAATEAIDELRASGIMIDPPAVINMMYFLGAQGPLENEFQYIPLLFRSDDEFQSDCNSLRECARMRRVIVLMANLDADIRNGLNYGDFCERLKGLSNE